MTKSHLLGSTAVHSPPSEAGATEAKAKAPAPASQVSYPPERKQSTSAVSRRGRPQAPRAPPAAYSVAAFCEAHSLSIALFYKLRAKGEAPDVMKVGSRTLISAAAADRWRRDRERATRQLKQTES
jgi:hypothetical protein